MAGSLNHIVSHTNGKFRMKLIENLGDAREALEECYLIIQAMSGGSKKEVNEYCKSLGFPEIKHDMTGI